MGSKASKNKANTSTNEAKKGGEKLESPLAEVAPSAEKVAEMRAIQSKARRSRMLRNETRKKITRQLSCVPQNRATAQRTRAAERISSNNAASAMSKGMDEDDVENKEEAHALAKHLINISPFNKRWKVLETLSEGTYGVVFSVQDIITQTNGVIKVAKAMPGEYGNQTAEWEQFVLEKMFRANPGASVVRILDKGMLVDQNNVGMEFMVLEKVEIDVQTYIYEETGAARRVRVCNVALQTLKGIYDLHMQGLLHRDLKPENMGICSREQPIVLIFDLGLARMYTDADGAVRPPRTVVPFRGSPEWASGNACKNREQTRFDDLVAWLYVVVELFDPVVDSLQPLPWSQCKNNGAIRYLKSAYCPARLLLRHCPSQFYTINAYIQSAHRYKAPDYGFIADRVMEAIEECKNQKSVLNLKTAEA